MNRRQLLKGVLTGCAAAVAAPVAHALGKKERGTAAFSASPPQGTVTGRLPLRGGPNWEMRDPAWTYEEPALEYLFEIDTDADYILQDDSFDFHFYPKTGLGEWFETDHYVRPQELGNGMRTRGVVFVKYKEGADKYAGYAAVLGVPRHAAKEAHYRHMYGIRDPRVLPTDNKITVIDRAEPFGLRDYQKLEERVLAAFTRTNRTNP